MQSIGLVIKEEQMIIAALKQRVRSTDLQGYYILPFLDFKDTEKEEAILYNLDRFLKMYKGGRDNVFLALPRDKVILQYLSLPLAVEENLQATLGYEMDRYTPFTFDDVYFDYYVLKRSAATNLLEVMLVAVKKAEVDYYLSLLKKVNVQLRGIEITPTALFNLFQKQYNGSEELLPIDWMQKNQLIEAVYIKFPQLFPKKFEIRKKEETANPPTVDALIEYMNGHYELNLISEGKLYYSRSIPLSVPSDAKAADPELTLQLQGIQQEARKGMLQLPGQKQEARLMQFFVSGREVDEDYLKKLQENTETAFTLMQDFAIRLDEKIAKSKLPVLAAAIGLAFKGISQVPIDINLIPAALRPKKKRSKKKIAAVILAVALFSLAGGFITQNIIEDKIQLAALDEQLIELKHQVKSLEEMQAETSKVEQYTSAMNQIKEEDFSKLKILEELTKIIPMDSWITDFDYQGDEKRLKISGYAVSASRLIPILEKSKLFENVKFTSPITKGSRVKENFKIEMSISPQKE